MKISSRYQALLDKKGITLLEEFGIVDVALKRQDALIAVDFLREDGISILGGDVFFQVGNALELAYANWFTEQRVGEDLDTFIKRTCLETANYIEGFPSKTGVTPLFALVVSKQ
jgi:hypothetical protein